MSKIARITMIDDSIVPGGVHEIDIEMLATLKQIPIGAPANDRNYIDFALTIASGGFNLDPGNKDKPLIIAPSQIKKVEIIITPTKANDTIN